MKKILLLTTLIICLLSCTRQQITRGVGGTMTIKLPAGQELMEVTWKNDDLFYLTRPMTNDYKPTTKIFQESSSWGVLESKVIFIETR